MADEDTASAVRDRLRKLLPYRRQVRPASPASFAPFVDSEFQRIDGSTREIVAALQALGAVIAAKPRFRGAYVVPFDPPASYGDTVSHAGKVWFSLADDNASEPGSSSSWAQFAAQ